MSDWRACHDCGSLSRETRFPRGRGEPDRCVDCLAESLRPRDPPTVRLRPRQRASYRARLRHRAALAQMDLVDLLVSGP